MTWVVMFLAAVGAGFLQVLLPGPAWLGQAKWPLLLALVIYYALQRETEVMLVAGVLAGFMQDALSPGPLGLSAVVFVLVGWSLTRFRELLMSEAVVTQAFFGLAGAVVAGLAQYLLLLGTHAVALSALTVLHKTVGLAVEGLVCTPLVFWSVGQVDRLVGNTRTAKEVEGTEGELDGIT
ncbi:MAG: rod shape-determining protein MreD [Lentisphaerae bacterium]|nr:rod shape-determining protein MreD [Lentisphaerota bacterium]